MRTAGFASIDYTQARPVTLVYLYPTDVSRWGAWRDGWGLKITTFFVLLVFARSELLGLPHANVAQRTVRLEQSKNPLVSLLFF